mgnify:CR=1 FL=1
MVTFLTNRDVEELLPMKECIDVLEVAFSHAGNGLTHNQPRSRLRMPNGFVNLMIGYSVGPEISAFGCKIYTAFKGGSGGFLMMLYDSSTGELLSILEAGALGQIRTGAASGLATKYLAHADASKVGIIGTGYQAEAQLEAMCEVRNISLVKAFSRNRDKCESFAIRMGNKLGIKIVATSSVEELANNSDILVTITSSRDPILKGEWLSPGTHINAAGANHWMRREIDDNVVTRSDMVVVDDLSQALLECGDLLTPVERGTFRWEMAYELKDLASGKLTYSNNGDSITLFESQGIALEDVATAAHVYRKALVQNVGQKLPIK